MADENPILNNPYEEPVGHCATTPVKRKTKRNAAKPFQPWQPRELRLLGSDSDAELARLLGRSRNAIGLQRRKLGIPRADHRKWTTKEIQMLGARPDREVARLTGRRVYAVAARRLKLGIESWRSQHAKSGPPADPETTRLRFGPYQPPKTRRGAFLFCELRGAVKVAGYSDAPIPWPIKWKTRSLILCGDLARAVRKESALAVAEHWDVCTGTVTKWRAALETGPITEGTRQIKSYLSAEAMTPAVRARIAAQKRGKPSPLSPEGRARLLAVLHRPKSERWFKSMAPHFQARRGTPVNPNDRPWTAKEDRLVGKMPDREVAKRVGRSVCAVSAHRKLRQIKYVNPRYRPWTKDEIAFLGKLPDAEIVARTGHSAKSVQTKRQMLRLLVRPHQLSWTPQEDALLGTRPDIEIARLLGRFRVSVQRRRAALGIPKSSVHALFKYWTPDEDKLLGTAPDSAVAKLVGRSMACVVQRRLRLRVPSFRSKKRLLATP